MKYIHHKKNNVLTAEWLHKRRAEIIKFFKYCLHSALTTADKTS